MDKATVSFAAFESVQTTLEDIIRKLTITVVVSIILMFTSNMVWLYVWIHNINPDMSNHYIRQEQMLEVKASNQAIDEERKRLAITMNTVQKVNYDDLSRTEIEALIHEWIHSERDRAVMRRRLLDGICYEPLAEEFDLSVSQIKNIVRKCQRKLFL